MFFLAFEAAQEKSRSKTSPPRWGCSTLVWATSLYIFSGSAKTSAGIHLIHCLARESSVGMSKENDAEACSLKFPVLNTSPQHLFYSVVITFKTTTAPWFKQGKISSNETEYISLWAKTHASISY